MAVTDILLDDNNAIRIESGDLVVGESDQQHVKHILEANKGHFRQWPLVGYGARKKIGSPFDRQKEKQELRIQLRADNYNVREIIITDDFVISIDAKRII